jgi:hypothetical protein
VNIFRFPTWFSSLSHNNFSTNGCPATNGPRRRVGFAGLPDPTKPRSGTDGAPRPLGLRRVGLYGTTGVLKHVGHVHRVQRRQLGAPRAQVLGKGGRSLKHVPQVLRLPHIPRRNIHVEPRRIGKHGIKVSATLNVPFAYVAVERHRPAKLLNQIEEQVANKNQRDEKQRKIRTICNKNDCSRICSFRTIP